MTESEVEELTAILDPSRQAPRDSIRPLRPVPCNPPPLLDLFARAEVSEGVAFAPSTGPAGDAAAGGPVAEPTRSGERVAPGFMVEPAQARASAKAARGRLTVIH